uniref:Rho termination factor N-terminal domain-containing protein n=1 Tax=viral metagenome TaxID=1070528 RepID=A0A6C0C4X1_9ZZZZ
MISRGLLISLGVTTLSAALLFVYFKNKINDVENKVQIIFDLVQSHSQNQMNQQHHNDIDVKFHSQEQSNLIQVSDDDNDKNDYNTVSEGEDSEDEDSEDEDIEGEDSEDEGSEDEGSEDEGSEGEDSEGEEVVEEAKINKLNNTDLFENNNDLQNNNQQSLEIPNIKELEVSELNVLNNEMIQLNTKKDDEQEETDSLDELSDIDDQDKAETEKNDIPQDLKKFTVAVLKNLAEKKGLSNYKSLKKAALIKLIEEN